jgi:hypothetical protein
MSGRRSKGKQYLPKQKLVLPAAPLTPNLEEITADLKSI